MSSWNMGYQTETQYVVGYTRFLSPVNLYYILTSQGFDCPKIDHNFHACELGFGQGLTINIHAMSTSVKWYGNDFNPSQVNFAQNLAAKAGLTEHELLLSDDSFSEFLQRNDLPQLDYICLHGIWSWVSPENQQFIVDFAKNKLKVGGILYISYNTAPGFTDFEPVQHLIQMFDRTTNGPHSSLEEKFGSIFNFLDGLLKTSPTYAKIATKTYARVQDCLNRDYKYWAGEYMNAYWDVCYFDQVAAKLDEAKLSFACSVNPMLLIDEVNVTPKQQQFLDKYQGSSFGETLRDFITNEQFRSDLFIKGPRTLSTQERESRLNHIYLFLNQPISKISDTFLTRLGVRSLTHELHEPVTQILSDYQPHSIGEIKAALKDQHSAQQVEEAIMLLIGLSIAAVIRDPQEISDSESQRCWSFNRSVINQELPNSVGFLASPLLGGGVGVNNIEKTMLRIYISMQESAGEAVAAEGKKGAAGAVDDAKVESNFSLPDFAERLAQDYEAKGNVKEVCDKDITDHEQLVAEMLKFAENFKQELLPLYQGLGLI